MKGKTRAKAPLESSNNLARPATTNSARTRSHRPRVPQRSPHRSSSEPPPKELYVNVTVPCGVRIRNCKRAPKAPSEPLLNASLLDTPRPHLILITKTSSLQPHHLHTINTMDFAGGAAPATGGRACYNCACHPKLRRPATLQTSCGAALGARMLSLLLLLLPLPLYYFWHRDCQVQDYNMLTLSFRR